MNPYSHFSIPAFDNFLLWLNTTELRLFFYGLQGWDPLVVFVHILAAAILFGAILLIDLRLMGFGASIGAKDLAALAIPWSIGGGVTALLSGLLLLLFNPIAVGVHTFFLPKMALICLGFINAVVFHRFVKLEAAPATPGWRVSSIAGGVSIAIWAGVFLCASLNGTERITSSLASISP